ncbi:MAG: response regulator [Candidatus Delongbacteria bacterium]|nr:response regulator [Candidatus Delongbacteria bacterium]
MRSYKIKDLENLFVIDFDKIDWKDLKIQPDERLELLIVEDESSFRELLKDILETTDVYKIETAVNGRDGLEKYQEKKHDIIITDVMMDELTGIEMAEIILKLNPKQKIFFVSSWLSQKQMVAKFEKQFTEGYFQFIDKPFDLKDFQNRIYLFINDSLSNIKFNVLDKSALGRTMNALEPYQLLVLHREILHRCIYLSEVLLKKKYERENITNLFLNNKDYMKSVGCDYDEVYCRGNVCVNLSPRCMAKKLKHQMEIMMGLIEEIYQYYKKNHRGKVNEKDISSGVGGDR